MVRSVVLQVPVHTVVGDMRKGFGVLFKCFIGVVGYVEDEGALGVLEL